MTLTVEVSYRGDVDLALRTAREVLTENARVLKTSEPQVGIASLADSGVRITLRPWCKAEDYWQVQYEV